MLQLTCDRDMADARPAHIWCVLGLSVASTFTLAS